MAQAQYDSVKLQLENTIKKILNYENRRLPDGEKIDEYKEEIVRNYNLYVGFLQVNFSKFSENNRPAVERSVNNFKLRLLRALRVLGYEVELPVKFNLIALADVKTLEQFGGEDGTQIFVSGSIQKPAASGSGSVDLNETLKNNELSKQVSDDDKLSEKSCDSRSSADAEHDLTIKNLNDKTSQSSVNTVDTNLSDGTQTVPLSRNHLPQHTTNSVLTMAQTKEDFFKIATGVINYKFNGDPVKLRSFFGRCENCSGSDR